MNSTTPHPRLAIALAYSLLLLIALAGCNNNDTPTTALDLPGKPVEVNIIANGIESFVDTPAATRSADAAPAWLPANEQTVHTQAQPLPNGCMMVVTATSAQATTTATTRATTRATPLANTTLRVVAYTATGEYVDDCLYNLNANGTPKAQEGQSLVVPVRSMPYTFYSYSPGTLAFDTDMQVVAVGPHDDFAFAKHLAVVDGSGGSAQAVTIPTLQLQSCRIGVKVTFEGGAVECKPTLGMTTSYTRCSLFGMAIEDYKEATTEYSPTFPLPSGNAEIAFPASKTGGKFEGPYLSFPNNQLVVDGETITVNPIGLLADDGTGTLPLAPGHRFTFSVNIYRPSPEINYVVVGGLKVAKGNLMRAGSSGHWFLAPDQGYYTGLAKGGDYFNWRMPYPTTTSTSNAEDVGQGCAAVLGTGWRTPTKSEFDMLASINSKWGDYNSQRGKVRGIYFGTTSAPGVDNQDQFLFLPANGNRKNSSSTTMVNVGEGKYWSDERSTNGVNIGVGLNFSEGWKPVQESNFALYGRGIRCVSSN